MFKNVYPCQKSIDLFEIQNMYMVYRSPVTVGNILLH